MVVINLFVLSLRYFRLHIRQYLFLLVALSFGFGVITTLSSLRAGMEENLYKTSQSHYAGDIILLGDNKKSISSIGDTEKIEQIIKDSAVPYDSIIRRTTLGDGYIYYDGAVLRQKYVIGVDWDKESELFATLNYSEISEDPFGPGTIIISSPVAQQMHLRVGDSLVLEVRTKKGQVNTSSLLVGAIVDDHSIFGYFKCYISRTELNRLIQYGEDDCSNLGIYLAPGASPEEATQLLYNTFSSTVDTAPLVADRDELDRERGESWSGIRYFILPLSVYLSEVAELLMAIEMVSYFLYIMMLLIIIVSVLVTYRLLLHEREKELGTMRAIVFTQGQIVFMLLVEMMILFLLSVCLGFLVAKLAAWGSSFLSFDSIASFEIFMKDGHLTAVYTIGDFLRNCGIVLAALLPAVIWPVYNASRQPLAVVLSGGNK